MKFSVACVQALSLASFASAAPAPAKPSTVAFPPESAKPDFITFEEAVELMQPPGNVTEEGSSSSTAAANGEEGSMTIMAGCRNDIRRRWGTLTPAERDNFVGAVRCLTRRPPRGIWGGARSLYDELVWVHAQLNGQIHQLDLFLPWHRYYLHVFKRLLVEQCGFNGPIPWWKETNNAGNFPASDIFSDRWFGALPQAVNGAGQCLTNGAFAGLMDPINNRCVARGEIKAETNEITIGWEDVCHGQQGNTFPQHRSCVELSNHARLHRGLGPTMANAASSPADPIFFLHHQYIDWQWKRWQNVQPTRWQTIQGCANKANPCAPLTRNTVLTSLGLYRDMTVGEILDTEGTVTCYTYDLLV